MFPAALAALLSLFLFCTNVVVASPFVVTSYVEEIASAYEYSYTYESTTSVDYGPTYTRLVAVKPTAASIETLSAQTTTAAYYSDVTIINVLVASGVGEPITRDYEASTTSYYGTYVGLTYTAPSSCASHFTFTTTAAVYLPPMITPTPTSVSTRFSQYEAFGPTSTYFYAFIDPSILPESTLSSLSRYYLPTACSSPYTYPTGSSDSGDDGSDYGGSGSGSGSGSSSGDSSDCSEYWTGSFQRTYECRDGSSFTKGISDLGFVLAIIFGWLGVFLIAGLIESYVAFSRLARGRRARRGLPIAFAGMFPILSCFFLCCHQRGFQAKTPAEQETLTAEWKATGFGTKLGRWLKWGFRYKYPTFLGAAPLRRRKWQDKDLPTAPVANGAQPMVGPQGPMPPPGSMYVVGNSADAAQRGSVYPPPPGAPPGGWYAPPQLDANGNPLPVQQYQYMYPPQGYAPQQGVPVAQGGIPEGAQQGVSPTGSPSLPERPEQAHLGVGEENRGVSGESPVSPASGLAGGSPVVAGGAPVVAGHEVAGNGEGSSVVHEAPAGEVRSNAEGKKPAVV